MIRGRRRGEGELLPKLLTPCCTMSPGGPDQESFFHHDVDESPISSFHLEFLIILIYSTNKHIFNKCNTF
jgi:hypothetical protein